MRTYLVLLLLTVGCSGGSSRLPLSIDGGIDAGDDVGDVSLLPDFGDDAGTADDDGGLPGDLDAAADPADAMIAADGSLPEPDAGDAGSATVELAALCEACSVDTDCAPSHICKWREVDQVKSCFPQFPLYTDSCQTYGEDLLGSSNFSDMTTTCTPKGGRTCLSWLGEYGTL